MTWFRFKGIMQADKWLVPGYVAVDAAGEIVYLGSIPPDSGASIEIVDGFALPGFVNAHSHAFQYAMAGLAERHPAGTTDDFWSWREAMYQCALTIDPDQMEAIAAMVYAEMLANGYTHVVEFHYLHHDKNGKPYSNLAEMGDRLVNAAAIAGIGITLVPVFYQKGGFGKDPVQRQRRFISRTVDDYFDLLSASTGSVASYNGANLGFSVHSLRAVNPDDIVTTYSQGPLHIPFHLHIAEQKKEVSDCLLSTGKRPVRWLLDNLPVDQRFNLIHATHLDDDELSGLLTSGATVVLCPSTEGNLGDGIFRMREYGIGKGKWTIGTDSHIGLNPIEELRMIDYRQRLLTNQRNTFHENPACYMVNEATTRGRRASGNERSQHFAIGQPMNAVVYAASSPLMQHCDLSNLLSMIVYGPNAARLYGTIVRGEWQVRNGRHKNFDKIVQQFSSSIKKIYGR